MKDLVKSLAFWLVIALIGLGLYSALTIVRNNELGRVVDSLQVTIKLKENMAKVHEQKAVEEGKKAVEFFIKANKLNDSLSQVNTEKLKWKVLYEKAIHNPVRFTRNSQRDSVLAILYPK